MLLLAIGVLLISSGGLCAPSDAVEVGVCNGDGCSALKSSTGAIEMARKELGCCTHADCLPSVTTVLCAHDVVTHFFQDASTSKVCSDFNEQCEALRVVKMNLQLSSNILGCHEREERAFLSGPSAPTSKLLEDLLPRSVVTAIHNALPVPLQLAKVQHAVGSTRAQTVGLALVGGHSDYKGNVYYLDAAGTGLWGGVCADGFTEIDADTVCKQLGFARAKGHYGRNSANAVVTGNMFGPVPAPFQITVGGVAIPGVPPLPPAVGLGCQATDATVATCPGRVVALAPVPPCNSNQVAGVECEAHPPH